MHTDPIPYGYCHCGCGGEAPIATYSSARWGWTKGQSKRFIHGHHQRPGPREYEAQAANYATPCWIWQWRIAPDGYGCKSVNGRKTPAHRAYWERAHGVVPAGMDLDHLCRNRACVNPAHLEVVSRAVNVQRGLLTKLTAAQVLEIRARAGYRNGAALAREFGVSKTTISEILSRHTWANI